MNAVGEDAISRSKNKRTPAITMVTAHQSFERQG
jgi:hypothetical protein